jgi:hypothetical protein
MNACLFLCADGGIQCRSFSYFARGHSYKASTLRKVCNTCNSMCACISCVSSCVAPYSTFKELKVELKVCNYCALQSGDYSSSIAIIWHGSLITAITLGLGVRVCCLQVLSSPPPFAPHTTHTHTHTYTHYSYYLARLSDHSYHSRTRCVLSASVFKLLVYAALNY